MACLLSRDMVFYVSVSMLVGCLCLCSVSCLDISLGRWLYFRKISRLHHY